MNKIDFDKLRINDGELNTLEILTVKHNKTVDALEKLYNAVEDICEDLATEDSTLIDYRVVLKAAMDG